MSEFSSLSIDDVDRAIRARDSWLEAKLEARRAAEATP